MGGEDEISRDSTRTGDVSRERAMFLENSRFLASMGDISRDNLWRMPGGQVAIYHVMKSLDRL